MFTLAFASSRIIANYKELCIYLLHVHFIAIRAISSICNQPKRMALNYIVSVQCASVLYSMRTTSHRWRQNYMKTRCYLIPLFEHLIYMQNCKLAAQFCWPIGSLLDGNICPQSLTALVGALTILIIPIPATKMRKVTHTHTF